MVRPPQYYYPCSETTTSQIRLMMSPHLYREIQIPSLTKNISIQYRNQFSLALQLTKSSKFYSSTNFSFSQYTIAFRNFPLCHRFCVYFNAKNKPWRNRLFLVLWFVRPKTTGSQPKSKNFSVRQVAS